MKNFYFTFGAHHWNVKGELMRHYYVKVIAPNLALAHLFFEIQFLLTEMPTLQSWDMVYTDEDFDPWLFPRGLYKLIA